MRMGTTILLSVLMALAFACSDGGSPTSPSKSLDVVSSDSVVGAAAVMQAGRTRHTIVVGARGESLPPGVWGSDRASLTINGTGARLEVLSLALPSGGCYGTFDVIAGQIPEGRFTLPGTHTQLTGVFPGHFDYTAQYSAVVQGNQITITGTVPSLPLQIGPFVLTRDVSSSWSPCLYP